MEAYLIPIAVVSAFIIADILTGILKGIAAQHSLRSSVMRVGMWSKLGSWSAVLVALMCKVSVLAWAGLPGELGLVYEVVAGYIVLMELTSILENIVEVNPKLAEGNKLFELFNIARG